MLIDLPPFEVPLSPSSFDIVPLGNTIDVTETIDIRLSGNQNFVGFVGPLTLRSLITDGSPVVRIHVDDPGINITNLLIEKLTILGSGDDGDGLVITCPTNSSWIYRSVLRDINVVGVGGNGIVLDGSVFESSLHNCWGNDNVGSGFVFRHNGGQVSAISVHGGGARKNHGWGAEMLDGARDVKWYGSYFCENQGGGLHADQGCTGLWGVGFENNKDLAIRFQNYINLYSCTFSTSGVQAMQLDGTLAGDSSVFGLGYEDYGGWTSSFATLGGSGRFSLYGIADAYLGPDPTHPAGYITHGPNVTVRFV